MAQPIPPTTSPAEESPGIGGLAEPSLIGNLADLKAGEILLPDFIAKREDGLYVDPAGPGAGDAFVRFVERVFSVGAYFRDLDYALFIETLLGVVSASRPAGPARLAAELVPFTPDRRALYKAVRVAADGESVEYLFQPVFLETNENVGGEGTATRNEPTCLGFDEFVAHLWGNGIRFGVDEKAVRRAIEQGGTERLEVARALAPTPGQDASIEEVSKALHRDNAPKLLPNGQIDLSQFGNRYPQVQQGEVLLRKVPPKPGQAGRTLSGELVEPDAPADFQLETLAGTGTRIERRGEGESIVAAMTGFLDLDPASNQIAVTEKIISREGVSMRTTGNLSLAGDDFEEYGEVQERRMVEGKNMTFHANVYGSLISRGGVIRIEATLSNGKARSPDGEVIVSGRASASVVEAPRGTIRIKYAEGCTIVADEVAVEHAVMCQIIARSVEIGTAEGCAIAARSARIAVCTVRKDMEAVVSMLVPDLALHEEEVQRIARELAGNATALEQAQERMAALQGQPEFANFLALQTKIRKGEIKLAPAQAASLQKAAARFAPAIQELRSLSATIHGLEEAVAGLTHKAHALEQAKAAQGQGIRCVIETTAGDTVVRTRRYDPAQDWSDEKQVSALLAQLRGFGESHERLFAGCAGRFAWEYGAEPAMGKDEDWIS